MISNGIFKKLSDVLLASSNHFTDNLGSVHYFWLNFQNFADLPCYECFACSRGPIEKHAFDMLKTKLPHDSWIDHSSAKDSTVDEF